MSGLASFAQAWRARTARERQLLLLLALVAGGVLGWYGVVQPLRAAAAAAEAKHARAAADLIAVEAAAKVLAAAPRPAGGVETLVTRTAGEAGLIVDRQRVERPGVVTVWINGAEPAALFPWLYGLQQKHGLSLHNMAATRDGQGALQVELVVGGAGA